MVRGPYSPSPGQAFGVRCPGTATANGGHASGQGDERIRGGTGNGPDNRRTQGERRAMTASSNWTRRNGTNYRRLCAAPGMRRARGRDPAVPADPARGLAGRPRRRRSADRGRPLRPPRRRTRTAPRLAAAQPPHVRPLGDIGTPARRAAALPVAGRAHRAPSAHPEERHRAARAQPGRGDTAAAHAPSRARAGPGTPTRAARRADGRIRRGRGTGAARRARVGRRERSPGRSPRRADPAAATRVQQRGSPGERHLSTHRAERVRRRPRCARGPGPARPPTRSRRARATRSGDRRVRRGCPRVVGPRPSRDSRTR